MVWRLCGLAVVWSGGCVVWRLCGLAVVVQCCVHVHIKEQINRLNGFSVTLAGVHSSRDSNLDVPRRGITLPPTNSNKRW